MLVLNAANMCCNQCSCFYLAKVCITISYATFSFMYSCSAIQTLCLFLSVFTHTYQVVDTGQTAYCCVRMWSTLSFLACKGIPEPLTLTVSVSPDCSVYAEGEHRDRGRFYWGLERGGRAQLLLGGGISVILLVLFMLTSSRLVRLS